MKKKFLLFLMLLTVGTWSYAQVTTSSMSGRVTDGKDALIGATVLATHQPSGTRYGVVTNNDGYYTIQGMRSGGPYTVEVSYVGYTKASYENITLPLGENYPLDASMKTSNVLGDVVVVGLKITEKTGTNTNVSSRQLETLPTVQRSLYDFTRLSPYSGSNYSFAGRDGRYNNITIDGAAFNNYFGLSANNLPGGDSQPISLDAIQEVSVNIAPYNITQSAFTGASINAVTRSGDNTLKGAAYAYFRPGSFNGDHMGSVTIPGATSSSKQTYGLRLGGPMIKNKLFFFINGEFERKLSPSNAYSPAAPGETPSAANLTARTSADSLQMVKSYLISKYGYDPGIYQNFNNFVSQNYKILGRLDWNVNDKNKVSVRYNYVSSSNDILTNATSGGSPSLSTGRSSVSSVAFSNSFYRMNNSVGSITGEWNSQFTSAFSNKLLVNYTSSTDKRTTPSNQLFPFVDIFSGGSPYMSFGTELFSYNNQVVTNTLNVFNNLTYSAGAHTITGGISYDNYYFGNNYMREGTSYYRFASVADFLNNATPTQIAYQYGYGNDYPCAANVSFGIYALYLQDEWKILPNIRINYGIRLEQPIFYNALPSNATIDAFTFYNGYHFNVGAWPTMKQTLNPRIGFNWDVHNDRSLVFRGGTGIFTGLLPFVWFTNQPGANGMIQTPEVIATSIPAGTTFEPNFKNLQNNPLFQSSIGTLPKASVAVAEVGKNFKMPQIWRSNLAADIKLPQDVLLTVEGLYTKDVNAVIQTNVNLPDAQGSFTGADTRQRWTSSKINTNIASAMILGNTNQGYAYSLSAQLKKTFSFGLSAMLAYTYTMSKDVSPNPGSTAASAWSSNVAVNSLNSPGLNYSGFAVPHRLTGSLSYRTAYAKHFASTFSLFYNGAPQGRKSFTFTNDMNGDGNFSDLMYIPTQAQLTDGSFKFVNANYKDASGNSQTFTAADQATAFWDYIQSNSYLKSSVGKYVDRFGYVMPWVHSFDFKFLEDIYTNIGKHKYTVQLSFDVLNIGNMINSNWGTYKTMNSMSYDNIRLLTYSGVDANGLPSYTLNTLNLGKNAMTPEQNFVANSTWVNSPSGAWSAMFGVRLLF